MCPLHFAAPSPLLMSLSPWSTSLYLHFISFSSPLPPHLALFLLYLSYVLCIVLPHIVIPLSLPHLTSTSSVLPLLSHLLLIFSSLLFSHFSPHLLPPPLLFVFMVLLCILSLFNLSLTNDKAHFPSSPCLPSFTCATKNSQSSIFSFIPFLLIFFPFVSFFVKFCSLSALSLMSFLWLICPHAVLSPACSPSPSVLLSHM